jgi:uncharacterized membrane protein YgdD (TMEM256/DUF423 family)
MTSKLFLFIGSISAALAVIIGAFGAHTLKSKISAEMLAVFQTGVQYHFIHSIGLLIIGVINLNLKSSSFFAVSGWTMIIGIFLFSGSLYLLSTTGISWLGAITPQGGAAFIVSWILLAFGVVVKMK